MRVLVFLECNRRVFGKQFVVLDLVPQNACAIFQLQRRPHRVVSAGTWIGCSVALLVVYVSLLFALNKTMKIKFK